MHADVRFRVEFGRASGEDDELVGVMDLDVEVHEPGVSTLRLHQHLLKLDGCSVFSAGRTSACESWELDPVNQQVVFRFGDPFALGRATFHMTWTVNVTKLPGPKAGEKYWKGLYVLHYGPGSFHFITQFEPCNARSAYPCFDQPCTKQTFRLTLTNVPSGIATLSNTEIESETEEAGGTKSVTFKQTAPTPAYLTAWVMGVFDKLERTISLPNYEPDAAGKSVALDVRVFVPKDLSAQGYDGHYALDLVCKAVTFFTHEFRVNYPYGKLDNVSTPLHPLLGMENWGLITYSSGFLEVKAVGTALDRRKRIARLIAHEVLHQWFGNSTTVGWWSALYCKEGFARLLEYVFVDHVFPEWHYFDHFQSDIFSAVLQVDEQPHRRHPVQHRIDMPAQIFTNVDLITYAKGAGVLRQLWAFLGAEVFFSSLQLYLRRHRNDCVMPDQLWQAMTDASGGSVNVGALMDCWVTKAGHPFLRVSRGEHGVLVLEQFLCENATGPAHVAIEDPLHCIERDDMGRSLFSVPVVMRNTEQGEKHKFIMDTGLWRISNFECKAFPVLNADSCGFYRVQYDEALLVQLLAFPGDVREIELCTIAVDTLYFCTRGNNDAGYERPSAATLMELIQCALERVKSHYLWQLLLPAISELLQHLKLSDKFGHVASALRQPVNRFYETLRGENAEFGERGHLADLEDVLCLVCSPLDPYGLVVQGGCDDALFRIAHEISSPAIGDELEALLHPIDLCCRSPILSEVASRNVLALLADPGIDQRIKTRLERIAARSSCNNAVQQLVETTADVGSLMDRNRGNIRLARAVCALCTKRSVPPPSSAVETIAQDAVGERVRAAFSLFSWRRGSLSHSSSSSAVLRDRKESAKPVRTKGEDRYVPWTQYATLGAVALGAVMLSVAGYMLIKKHRQAE